MLAVLPFENASNAPDTKYLSNEIPASIIDKMSGLSGLSVISRSGAFRFDPTKEDASTFGRKLGVSVVLTGQLNVRGNSLTIRAELVDVETNQQLWSERALLPSAECLLQERRTLHHQPRRTVVSLKDSGTVPRSSTNSLGRSE